MVSRPAPPTKAPCQDSLSLRLRASLPLTSPARTTRRFIMQKARRHPINGAPTACGQTGSGSISLPCPGCFSPFPHGTRPLSVFGEYLALPDGPGGFTLDYPCPALLRMPPPPRPLARKGLSPATARLSRAVPVRSRGGPRGPTTPGTRRHDPGLGSSAFARHYLRNHVCFLFLRVLRCFSSPRSPPGMCRDGTASRCRVAPFGNPGIKGHLLLPRAYRSLSRPSSPPEAKASTVCPALAFPSISSVAPATRGTFRRRARCRPHVRGAPRAPLPASSSFQLVKDLRAPAASPPQRGPGGPRASKPAAASPSRRLPASPAPQWRIRGSNPWPPACKAGALSRLS